jgi:hypothetical protein
VIIYQYIGGLWRLAVHNKCNYNCLNSLWACLSYCTRWFYHICDVWLMKCNLSVMHFVLCKLTMDGNTFQSWDYRNKSTLYVGLQKRQCQQQDKMQLISQASPNIVPAAMLPIARPWMEAWCSYGSDSIRCIKFPSQYCYCCFLCYWSQPTDYWHQNFIFGTLLLMLSITKQVVLNMDQKWYISGYWHGGEYGGVHSAHRDISKCEWNFVFPCDTKYFDACSAVCRRYMVFI